MSCLLIEAIPCLRDNYAYVITREGCDDAIVVDPSEAAPLQSVLEAKSLRLVAILATHHHGDHIGGVLDLVTQTPDARVCAHALDRGRIPAVTDVMAAPKGRFARCDRSLLAALTPLLDGLDLLAMHVPGHTRGAIAWGIGPPGHLPTDVFTGDTLFAAGCGRLFEGTAEELFHSLAALGELPGATRLWFGHEYTRQNLDFAKAHAPHDEAILGRLATLASCTTPTNVALEQATNLFLRAPDVASFAALRRAKDAS